MTRIATVLTVLFALITAACVAFGAYFSYVTLLSANRAAVEERFTVTAARVATTAELANSLGIAVASQHTLEELVAREAGLDAAVRSIDVADEHGQIVFSSDAARQGTTLPPRAAAMVSRRIENDIGATIGRVAVSYDPAVLQRDAAQLAADIRVFAVPAVLLAALATGLAGLLIAGNVGRALRNAGNPARWPASAQAALGRLDRAHAAALVGAPAAGEAK